MAIADPPKIVTFRLGFDDSHTLERYLAERRSVIESARALYIHPNTLRQRLGRIEELTGMSLDADDLLSLELAIKLARLHGRPAAGP